MSRALRKIYGMLNIWLMIWKKTGLVLGFISLEILDLLQDFAELVDESVV